MNKRFAVILAVLIIGFVGIFIFTKNKADAPGESDSKTQLSNNVTGAGKSGVVLIEYGDFQCSACYSYEPAMQQVREKYKDQITFQFRHFPISEKHKNAVIASRAAEAAGMQGKFWEMHDKLFETQDPQGQTGWVASNNPTPLFTTFAQEMGLNVDKFQEDLKSTQTNNIVQADREDAKKRGFTGTPTFMLDGKTLENTRADISHFSGLIDAAIQAKQLDQE